MVTERYVPSSSSSSVDRQVTQFRLNKKSCTLDDAEDRDDAEDDLPRLQATRSAGETGIGIGVSPESRSFIGIIRFSAILTLMLTTTDTVHGMC